MKFRVALDWGEIWSDKFLTEWVGLYNTSSACGGHTSPFTHPAAIKAWTLTFNQTDRYRPFFVLLEENGKILAIFPLVVENPRWQRGFLRRLTPIGERYFDYHDPLLADSAVITGTGYSELFPKFLSFLNTRVGLDFDCFSLPRYRFSNDSAGWRLSDKAPILYLDDYESMDHYFQKRKKRLRDDVRRQLKRAREIGPLRLVTNDDISVAETLNLVASVRYHRERKYPGSPVPRDYLENLVEQSSRFNGPVHVSSLLLDETEISWHIGFETKNSHYWYIPTYHDDYSSISPGKLHVYFAIERAIEKELNAFDFLRGLESYKAGWTDGEVIKVFGCEAGPQTASGKLKKAMGKAMNAVNSLRRT